MASWGKHLFPVRGRPRGHSVRPLKSIRPRVRPRQLKSTNSINLFLSSRLSVCCGLVPSWRHGPTSSGERHYKA